MAKDNTVNSIRSSSGLRERKRKRSTTPMPQESPVLNIDPATVQLQASEIINEIKDNPASGPFMRLPSKRQFADYYLTIKRPICVEDIMTKNEGLEYLSLEALKADVDLIFNNAKRYNRKESMIYQDAQAMQKTAKEHIASFTEPQRSASPEHKSKKAKHKKSTPPSLPPANVEQVLLDELYAYEEDNVLLSPIFEDMPSRTDYPEYYQIIQHPIALNVIRKKLKKGGYSAFGEFDSDVRRVFDNAMLFNEEQSQVHEDAKTLLAYFEKRKKELDIAEDKAPKLHVNGPAPKIKIRVNQEDVNPKSTPSVKIRLTQATPKTTPKVEEEDVVNEDEEDEEGDGDGDGDEDEEGGDGDYDGTEDEDDHDVDVIGGGGPTVGPTPSALGPNGVPRGPPRMGRPTSASAVPSYPQPPPLPLASVPIQSQYIPAPAPPPVIAAPLPPPPPPRPAIPVRPTPPLLDTIVLHTGDGAFGMSLNVGALNAKFDSMPNHAIMLPDAIGKDQVDVKVFLVPSERGISARKDNLFQYKVIYNGRIIDPDDDDDKMPEMSVLDGIEGRDDVETYKCRASKGLNSVEVQVTAPRLPPTEEEIAEREAREKARHTRRTSPLSTVETQRYSVFLTRI